MTFENKALPFKPYYLILALGLAIHGVLVFFTFESTYDAFVHIFFADHYAENWFDTWDQRWYTGFTITSYPPLVHQGIALLSKLAGLKLGFVIWSCLVVVLLLRGVYQFSLLWVNEKAALYATLFAVFSTSIAEALHIFGQLPSLTGSALLLNACPEIYRWARYGYMRNLVFAFLLLAVTSSAHHVTTIFGMVFFVLPVLGLAVFDRAQDRSGSKKSIHLKEFLAEAISQVPRMFAFGFGVIMITVLVIFPYWYWTKSDPITQVPIPHGSRDSFIEMASSGLVFFLIPWGIMLFFLPFMFTKLLRKRYIFMGISVILLFLLGTGGTTPLPRMLLGETAFQILTLDRFTYWATLIALPFWGLFLFQLFEGEFKAFIVKNLGPAVHWILAIFFLSGILLTFVLVVNIGNFRTLQPHKIEIEPITNFLEKDYHYRWRFLTLGFGDQMAWLSANTGALSVDGNYHSVRRLPEMTTRAVERLENAKFQGEEGLSALKQFLSVPERYNLKFIFSNDKYYDPLLHFSGWRKLDRLENDIVVWEKPGVPPLPSLLPVKEIPGIQRLAWGIIPMGCFFGLILYYLLFYRKEERLIIEVPSFHLRPAGNRAWSIQFVWVIILAGFITFLWAYFQIENKTFRSPENLINGYYHALDFKEFKKAYTYMNPETRPSLDQFLLQNSLKGGILSSYAKLDAVNIKIKEITDEKINASVTTSWVTSLMTYYNEEEFIVTKKAGSWYLETEFPDPSEPLDTYLRLPGISFHSQGRRKAIANATSKRDILDRPELSVIQARLVEKNNDLFIVGELENTDADPAYVSLKAILTDQSGKELLQANACDVMNHRLLPGEKTPFRIELQEEIKSRVFADSAFAEKLVSFKLFAQSEVTDEKIYKAQGYKVISFIDKPELDVNIINYGTKEVIIPQAIFAYHNEGRLIWVDCAYLPFSIRPQRKQPWKTSITAISEIKLIHEGVQSDFSVNGIISDQASRPERNTAYGISLGAQAGNIEIFLNGFIKSSE